MVALSWVLNSFAASLGMLYLGNALGGTGAGIVYGITIGNALRWFPDRRGLAAGLTAAAFGAGSALTVAPIRFAIEEAGYKAAFFWFGLGQGAMVLAVGVILVIPGLRHFYALKIPDGETLVVVAGIACASIAALEGGYRFARRFLFHHAMEAETAAS